jgi:RNase P subunit RPR2
MLHNSYCLPITRSRQLVICRGARRRTCQLCQEFLYVPRQAEFVKSASAVRAVYPDTHDKKEAKAELDNQLD